MVSLLVLLVILDSECWKQIRWDYRHSSSIAGGCFIPDMAQHVMPSKQGPHVSSFGAKWWFPRLQKGKQRNIWKILGLELDQWSDQLLFLCFFVAEIHLGVSKKRGGPPNWMVKIMVPNPMNKWMIWEVAPQEG